MTEESCCHDDVCSSKTDWLLWLCAGIIAAAAFITLVDIDLLASHPEITTFSYATMAIMKSMLWGMAFGIFFTGLMADMPKEIIMAGLGRGWRGVARATMAGMLVDVCSHGVLLIGMQLYRRGASLGQVFAFLIATPWNSFSTMFILCSMVGEGWTTVFVVISLAIALITGWMVEWLTIKGKIAPNPNTISLPENYNQSASIKQHLRGIKLSPLLPFKVMWRGFMESLPLLRWVLLGAVLAAGLRTFMPQESFQHWFGASISGLALTLVAAALIEVCSEGSVPLAADLLLRGQAAGNAFAFLMAGASADYTEIMLLRQTTGRWSFALLLPAISLPQIIFISWLLNQIPA